MTSPSPQPRWYPPPPHRPAPPPPRPPQRRPPASPPTYLVLLAVLAGLLILAVIVAFVVQVAGSLSPNRDTAANPPAAAPTEVGPACLPVGRDLLDQIAAGAQAGTGLVMTGRAGAVASPNHASLFLVAAEFTATGTQAQVAVWATNRAEAGGLTLSADAMAKQFTTWPDAAKADTRIELTDPSIDAARACLR